MRFHQPGVGFQKRAAEVVAEKPVFLTSFQNYLLLIPYHRAIILHEEHPVSHNCDPPHIAPDAKAGAIVRHIFKSRFPTVEE